MVNILVPAMGKTLYFKDIMFPKMVLEIGEKTILERILENYNTITEKNFIFVFDKKDCLEFHLDESVKILTGVQSKTILLDNETGGALCTCLMAINAINNDNPLVIANSDQIIDVNYMDVIEHFIKENYDAGVITFNNIHPRWSYAKIVGNEIVEVAEKRPISKNAIAGFYFFRHGRDFVDAAKSAIIKKNQHNGKYYISASLNEVILKGKRVGAYNIKREQYHSFYAPQQITEYESVIKRERHESTKTQ